MCDYPSCYTEREVTGRTPHRCCECTRLMPVGERHQVITGIWDREPLRFRTCLSCVAIRRWMWAGIRAGDIYGDDDCGVVLGDLASACFDAYDDAATEGRVPEADRDQMEATA